ncbi:MAG: T9SS type A sorting domain-containing protein [Bacteroidota bacterium]
MKTIILSVIFFALIVNYYGQFDAMGVPGNTTQQESVILFNKNSLTVYDAIIINTIPSPIPYIAGITYDGQNLLAEGYNEYQIYSLNPADGSIIRTIPTDIQRPYGLSFDGTNIWILDNANKIIKQLDITNGDIISSLSIDYGVETYPTGLVYIDGNLWYNDPIGPYPNTTGDKTHNIDLSAVQLHAFDAFGDYPSGMTFDGQYMWTSDNSSGLIHQVDLNTFEIIKTIEAPGGAYPNGLAWDGNYLWVANNDADSIYQLDVGNTTKINNSFSDNIVSVFPNPASDKLNFSFPEQDADVNIEIYDINGRLITEIYSNSNPVVWNCTGENGEKPEPGYYLYRIIFDNSTETGSFCIINK